MRPRPCPVDIADAVGFRADRPAAELAAQSRRARREALRRDLLAIAALMGVAAAAAAILFSLLA